MSKFQIYVDSDGHVLVVAPETLSRKDSEHLIGLIREWKETPEGVLVLGSAEIHQVQTIELEVPEDA